MNFRPSGWVTESPESFPRVENLIKKSPNAERIYGDNFSPLWWKFLTKSTWLMIKATTLHPSPTGPIISSHFIGRDFRSRVGSSTCVRFPCRKQSPDDDSDPRRLFFYRISARVIDIWTLRKIFVESISKVRIKHPVLAGKVEKCPIRCVRCWIVEAKPWMLCLWQITIMCSPTPSCSTISFLLFFFRCLQPIDMSLRRQRPTTCQSGPQLWSN